MSEWLLYTHTVYNEDKTSAVLWWLTHIQLSLRSTNLFTRFSYQPENRTCNGCNTWMFEFIPHLSTSPKGFVVNFTFLGKRGAEDMQSMKSSLFQFKAVQRSGARHIPYPQHSNLRVWQANTNHSLKHFKGLLHKANMLNFCLAW